MDPDIDEFNEDVEIPKDLDCRVFTAVRPFGWGPGESGEVVFLLYSWYIDVDGFYIYATKINDDDYLFAR